jgi:hypothetical protein
MAVDHRQAGAQVAGEVEGGDAGTKGESREGVAQIVDAPQRRDAGGVLGGSPVAVAEVVQIEVPSARRGKQHGAVIGGQLLKRCEGQGL